MRDSYAGDAAGDADGDDADAANAVDDEGIYDVEARRPRVVDPVAH